MTWLLIGSRGKIPQLSPSTVSTENSCKYRKQFLIAPLKSCICGDIQLGAWHISNIFGDDRLLSVVFRHAMNMITLCSVVRLYSMLLYCRCTPCGRLYRKLVTYS